MSEQSSLLLEFETDDGNGYLYDAVTNRVFCAPSPMPEMVESYKHRDREEMIAALSSVYSADVLEDYYDQVQRWVEVDKAFFPDKPLSEAAITTERDRLKRRECRSPHLILILTQDCNLACGYCVQDHTNLTMTLDTARQGIDRFLECNANTAEQALDTISIGFYGGEPLLEYDLMCQCVAYVRARIAPVLSPMFFITTNATLLTDATADYLVENEFQLSVSLDGPKVEHDRNRKTRNGRGTSDLVFDNLTRLRERYREYYDSNVSLIATLDFASDTRAIMEWFYENRSILHWVERNDCRSCIAQQVCASCYITSIAATEPFDCEAKRRRMKDELELWYSVFESNPGLIRRMRSAGDQSAFLEMTL